MAVSFDFAAIGRILVAVAEFEDAVPEPYRHATSHDLPVTWEKVRKERASLARKISWQFEQAYLVETLGSDAAARRRFEALAQIGRHAKAIQALLSDDPVVWPSIRDHLGANSLWRFGVVDALEELKGATDAERHRRRSSGLDTEAPLKEMRETGGGGRPALVSGLASLYEEVFEVPAKVQYTSLREPDGGFVRFALAVFQEAGEKTTGEAIRKAFERSPSSDKGAKKS